MNKENSKLAVISPRMMDIMEYYINMLERENELLKNDYNIANDGLDDLNDVVKDLRKENEELKADNKELKLLSCTDDCQDNVNSLIKLKAELDKVNYATQEMDGMIMKLEDEKKDLRIACKVLKDGFGLTNREDFEEIEELKALIDDLKKDKAIQFLKADNKKRLNERGN